MFAPAEAGWAMWSRTSIGLTQPAGNLQGRCCAVLLRSATVAEKLGQRVDRAAAGGARQWSECRAECPGYGRLTHRRALPARGAPHPRPWISPCWSPRHCEPRNLIPQPGECAMSQFAVGYVGEASYLPAFLRNPAEHCSLISRAPNFH